MTDEAANYPTEPPIVRTRATRAEVDTGGPAFPITIIGEPDNIPAQIFGMSLRDWFAGQALCGMGTLQLTPESAASASYEYADAMIRERAKRG